MAKNELLLLDILRVASAFRGAHVSRVLVKLVLSEAEGAASRNELPYRSTQIVHANVLAAKKPKTIPLKHPSHQSYPS